MVAPPSDLTSTNSRAPLPSVSENSMLQPSTMPEAYTPPKTSATYSRPTSVQNTPQFAYTNTPHPQSTQTGAYFPPVTTAPSSTTPPPLFSSNSNGMSTKLDMDRIMKQDEAAMNDFVPPRQAMNSDESDFDWDEDINIDEKGVSRKKDDKSGTKIMSKWRQLSPLSRMLIMILIGCPIVALPAILTQKFKTDDAPLPAPGAINPDGSPVSDPAVPKATIVMIFVWLSFMWGIIFLTNWGVDIVPVVVVRVTSVVTRYRLENVKSKLLVSPKIRCFHLHRLE